MARTDTYRAGWRQLTETETPRTRTRPVSAVRYDGGLDFQFTPGERARVAIARCEVLHYQRQLRAGGAS